MPIGSIYLSLTTDNPSILFGGTWERIKDTFLLAAGDTYALGGTGGASTHIHSTTAIALTEAQLPNHTHKGLYWYHPDDQSYLITLNGGTYGYKLDWTGMGGSTTGGGGMNENAMRVGTAGSGATHSHGNTGSTSNIPPYLAVYIWKRIS